jgi:hypothetical protein
MSHLLENTAMHMGTWIGTLLTTLLYMPAAIGGVMVEIGSATFAPGAAGTLDVTISSSTNLSINSAAFEFLIEPQFGTATQLRFSSPQNDLQLTFPSYLFAAESLKRDGDPVFGIPSSSVGTITTSASGYTNDRFVGSDSTVDLLSSVTLTSTPRLLVRLQFVSGPGLLSPIEGDLFKVSLVGSPFTEFIDGDFEPIAYSSTPGLISISAVPEPTSIFCLLVGLGTTWLRLRTKPTER